MTAPQPAVVQKKIFYPEPGASAAPALRICAVCTVRTDCLIDAMNRRDVTFGVRGGLTPTQRRALLRQGAARVA